MGAEALESVGAVLTVIGFACLVLACAVWALPVGECPSCPHCHKRREQQKRRASAMASEDLKERERLFGHDTDKENPE